MATTTEAQERAMSVLDTLELMLADLPEVADQWERLTDGERASWSIDWSNELSGLKSIAQCAADGLLAAGQHERYQEVLRKLKAARPTIRRLSRCW